MNFAQQNESKIAKGLANAWLQNIETHREYEATDDAPKNLTREQIASSSRDCLQMLALHAVASATIIFAFEANNSEAADKAETRLVQFMEQYDAANQKLDSDADLGEAFRLRVREFHEPLPVYRNNESLIEQNVSQRLRELRDSHSSVAPGAPLRNRASFQEPLDLNDANNNNNNNDANAEPPLILRAATRRILRELGLESLDFTSRQAIDTYVVLAGLMLAVGVYKQRTPAARVRYFRSKIAGIAIGSIVYAVYIAFQWQVQIRDAGFFTTRALDNMASTPSEPGNWWYIPAFIGDMISGGMRFLNELSMDSLGMIMLLAGLVIELGLLKLVHYYTEQGQYDVAFQEAERRVRELNDFIQNLMVTNPPNRAERVEEARVSLQDANQEMIRLGQLQTQENNRTRDRTSMFQAWFIDRFGPRIPWFLGGVNRPDNITPNAEPQQPMIAQPQRRARNSDDDNNIRLRRGLANGQRQIEQVDEPQQLLLQQFSFD